MLGLEKLAWHDILPGYEPFKYGAFAINASDVSYRITRQIQLMLDAASASGTLADMPPTQAFFSVVDATVSVPALVERLYWPATWATGAARRAQCVAGIPRGDVATALEPLLFVSRGEVAGVSGPGIVWLA